MTQYKKSGRSHIRWDRLAIIMAGIIVIVAGIFVRIKMFATNPYEKYDACLLYTSYLLQKGIISTHVPHKRYDTCSFGL